MRAFLFYPLIAIAAALVIAASFGPSLRPPLPTAQTGRVVSGALVFDAEALSHMEIGPNQVASISRDDSWRPNGLQIATKHTQTQPSPSLPGARLMLDPRATAAFAGKPLLVRVVVRPIPVTTAAELAVSAQTPGPVEWQRQKIPADTAALSFRFPAIEGAAPSAIGLWPVANGTDYDYGIEIVEVRLSAAP